MHRLVRILLYATAAALLIGIYFIASNTWMSEGIEARVVDAATGQPVNGAIVLANWELKGWEGYVAGQLALFEVLTDEQGVFRIPAWGPRLNTAGGKIRGSSPEVRIFDRRYLPVLIANSPALPPREALTPKHFMKPSLDGQTVQLQPFHGTPAQYVQQLRPLQQSVEFLYSGGHCEWQQAPRTVAALHELRSELGDAASASGLIPVDAIVGPRSCGNAREFLKEYLR